MAARTVVSLGDNVYGALLLVKLVGAAGPIDRSAVDAPPGRLHEHLPGILAQLHGKSMNFVELLAVNRAGRGFDCLAMLMKQGTIALRHRWRAGRPTAAAMLSDVILPESAA